MQVENKMTLLKEIELTMDLLSQLDFDSVKDLPFNDDLNRSLTKHLYNLIHKLEDHE